MKPAALALALALAAAPGLAPAKTAPANALPKGMVAFFQLNACPTGWSDVPANWQGRYVVATVGGEAPGQVVGEALTPRENRPAGAHTHMTPKVFDGGTCNGGGCAAWGRDDEIQRKPQRTDTGADLKPGTNAPYVSLRACVRN